MKRFTKKEKLIGIISTILIIIILLIIITTNMIKKQNKIANENYSTMIENISSNLISSYIKKGITIAGITGTLEVLDTSDATANADNLSEGKTAYVNGVKVIGNGLDVNNAYNKGLEDGASNASGKLLLSWVQTTTSEFNRLLYVNNEYISSASIGSATFSKDANIKITYYAFSSLWGYARLAFDGSYIVDINNTTSASSVSKKATAGSKISSGIEGTYGAEVYICVVLE